MVSWPDIRPLFPALICIVIGACGGSDDSPVLTSIAVSPSELTLDALQATAQLEATARDQRGNILSTQLSWSSSDTAVISVDADGLVTASGNGTATVTVRSGSVSASATVTVEQTPASIALSQDEVVFTALGANKQLEASVLDANENAMSAELTWASSDPAIATVDEDGRITAQANGTATVTVSTGSTSDLVTLTVAQTVSMIELVPETVTLTAIDQRAQIAAAALDANGHPVVADIGFASSDSMVATVDGGGVVTALRNGMTTVTASTGPAASTATVTVRQELARITIVPDLVTLTAVGESTQLQVMALDANGIPMTVDVNLSSSDPAVASVNAAGLITAQADGTATITATVRDDGGNVSGSEAITVQVLTPAREPLTVTGDPNVSDPRTGRSPLHIAALANAPGLTAALVAAGADLEARDIDDMTPLHAAALADAPAAIAALLEAGANIEARNLPGHTPLILASIVRSPAAVAALLEAGADPDAHYRHGLTSLHVVPVPHPRFAHTREIRATTTILSALLEAGADPNARSGSGLQWLCYRPLVVTFPEGGATPLHGVAGLDNPAAVAAVLEAGSDPNALDVTGHPPLSYWAGRGEDPVILTALLEAGAEFQTRDIDGLSQLHLAAERDRPASVMALLDAGADLNARNNAGRTALHAATASIELHPSAVSMAAAAVAVLLDAGANPNARDSSGATPLQLAPAGSREMMSALMDAHAGRTVQSPNVRDAFGYTALHAAARVDSPRLIAALLEAGAEIDALDNEGNTPLLLASGPTWRVGLNVPPPSYSPAAIAALASAGANLDARDKHGFAALHRAAIWGRIDTMEVLLDAGADPAVLDDDGRTPLQVALEEWAFEKSDTAAIAALAEAEANRQGGNQNEFAAVVALAVGNPEALGSARVDLNARDTEGRTVMHWLPAWRDSVALPALSALLDAGADLNARDLVGRNAVDWAVWRRNPGMLAALAAAGADLNVPVRGRTALHQAIIWRYSEMVAALAAAGADPELRDYNGWTALQLAAHEGQPVMIAALVEAGADLEARDDFGRTALQLAADRDNPGGRAGGPSTPAAVAALVEAGANLDAYDSGGTTALNAAAVAGNQGATVILLALGANWTSDSAGDLAEVNARIVAMELFQGPMAWRWGTAGSQATGGEESGTDHARTLLHRATTMAVRIGSENAEQMPELSVSLSDAAGRSWAVQADRVYAPRIVSLPNNSESGLWETEYVYELPPEWVESGHRASFAIDPHNRLEETDEDDNTATLTMDGYALPVFDVTFVPIVFSGDPPAIDTDTYMAVIGDLLPIGDYRARVGRILDLSDRNLGTSDRELSRNTALSELLQRWNAEAGANEYYHGVMSSAGPSIVIGGFGVFGGIALLAGHVAVSDAISESCQVEHVFCGDGVQAHELGHNFGLVHLPGRCGGPGAVDHAFPYADAGIGPRRGWVATRNEFVNPGADNPFYDLMGYCTPRFVSDYNYNKMVDYRLGESQPPSGGSGRIGPTLQIGAGALASSGLMPPTVAYALPAGVASASAAFGPAREIAGVVEATGPSLAFTGTVDEYGLWSTWRIDTSAQPPRPVNAAGDYFFTLQDAFQREIYREPMKLLTATHGEASRSWAVRVPAPDDTPVFLAILDAQGTPLYIEPIVVPPVTMLESNP